MRIIAVDDEQMQLKLLEKAILKAVPDCELTCFDNSVKALEWAGKNQPDVMFADIQMPVMTGIELAKAVKKLYPHTNIVFVTGYYEDYAVEAMALHFSGYLQKPATVEAVAQEMQNLRYPLPVKQQPQKLKVQCFGNFEVFMDGRPVHFERHKTKELLAFLVDRHGAQVNSNEICAVIYEDDSNEVNNKADLRKSCADLKKTLQSVGMGEVFIKGFNTYSLDINQLFCDYYDWEKGEAYAIRAFHGEYMSQYSWAEDTLVDILG